MYTVYIVYCLQLNTKYVSNVLFVFLRIFMEVAYTINCRDSY